MLLQLELRESLGQILPQKTFSGFSEVVLEEELPEEECYEQRPVGEAAQGRRTA